MRRDALVDVDQLHLVKSARDLLANLLQLAATGALALITLELPVAMSKIAFVMVLSYSLMIFLRFFLGDNSENFLRGHVAARELSQLHADPRAFG